MIEKMRRIDIAAVTILLLFAASLRIIGMSYGQLNPAYFPSYAPHGMSHYQLPIHPDSFSSVAIPVEMALRNRLNPEFFLYPSFIINVNYLLFRFTGSTDGLSLDDRVGFPVNTYAAFPLYFMSRVYGAFSGLIMVACAYSVSRMLSGRYAALCAGLLVATSFTLVTHAHYVKLSTPAAAWMMVAIWACVASLTCRGAIWRFRLYLLAGIACGFAASTLYHGVSVALVVVPAGLILLYRHPANATGAAVLLAWTAIPLCFVLASPYILLDFEHFWHDFSTIVAQYKEARNVPAYFTVDPWTGLLLLLIYGALVAFGIAPGIMAGIGMILAWRQPEPAQLFGGISLRLFAMLAALWLIPYAYVVLRTVRPGHSEQLLIPLIPVLATFSAAGATWLAKRIPLPKRIIMPALGLILVLQPLALSVPVVKMFSQIDTRQIMLRWIHDNIPAGSRFLVNGAYNVALDHAIFPNDRPAQRYIWPLPSGYNYDYMIFSDALAFDVLRSEWIVPQEFLAQQREYLAMLNERYSKVAEIHRPTWFGSESIMYSASYWHNPTLILYCLNVTSCDNHR